MELITTTVLSSSSHKLLPTPLSVPNRSDDFDFKPCKQFLVDELLENRRILTLKHPPRLQSVGSTPKNTSRQSLRAASPLKKDDFDPFLAALESVMKDETTGRESSGSPYRRARSSSPLRRPNWLGDEKLRFWEQTSNHHEPKRLVSDKGDSPHFQPESAKIINNHTNTKVAWPGQYYRVSTGELENFETFGSAQGVPEQSLTPYMSAEIRNGKYKTGGANRNCRHKALQRTARLARGYIACFGFSKQAVNGEKE